MIYKGERFCRERGYIAGIYKDADMAAFGYEILICRRRHSDLSVLSFLQL
jgi:hypothetical protein